MSEFRKWLPPAAPRSLSVESGSLRPVVTLGRIGRVVFGFLAVFLLVSFVSLTIGPGDITPASLIRGLFAIPGEAGVELDATNQIILFNLRFPRICIAAVVGAGLSASGVIFQAILRNPLADPYILGISGGAAVGAILGIILGAAAIPMGVSAFAFLGAILTVILLFGASGPRRTQSSHSLLLTGVIINAFFSAIIMFLLAVSKSDRLQSILYWLMGDLSSAEGHDIVMTGIILFVGFLIMAAYARTLNLLITGDETAAQLGVNVTKSRKVLLMTASTVTAAAVSVSGTIGFVGLIIPHILRLWVGADHRLLLPVSILFGATFLVAADTIARTIIAPVELPVGVVTALCGAPYFFYLLRVRGT